MLYMPTIPPEVLYPCGQHAVNNNVSYCYHNDAVQKHLMP